MSVPVEWGDLGEVIGRYRFAYLLTSTAGAPHAVAMVPLFEAGEFVVHGVGRRSRENLLARPQVSLVWPPETEAGYSLIVDGLASADADAVRIRPSRAVLHRPAPRHEPHYNRAGLRRIAGTGTMNNIKRRAALRSFLSIAGAALVSVAALPLLASAQAIDQLGVPGPIHFDGKVFGLAWSSKPSAVR